jgi:hypothetical protein
VIRPQLDVYRPRRARTTRLPRVQAALSRSRGNPPERGEIAPLIPLVERVFVIGRVACIDRRGAVTPQQRAKGFIDERGVTGAGAESPSTVEQLLIDSCAQSCASHAMSMPLACQHAEGSSRAMVTADDIRKVALSLPRTDEALVRDQVKFRVGRIVYVALSRDERSMGFGFPKDERAALVAAQPEKFSMPIPSDMRYNWVQVRLDAIDEAEMRELVIDAWTMVVPKRVAAEYLGGDDP